MTITDRPGFGIQRVRALMSDRRTQYVVISMVVNLLFLLRSYVFMLVLDYRELGLTALVQSIVMLLGILQFGVLNGGYRLILSDEGEERQRVVDFVYTAIAFLSLLAIGAAVISFFVLERRTDAIMGLLGAIGGGAMLVRTWQTNQMIAAGRLGILNAINFGSATLSLACFAFLPVDPLAACIGTIVAQPILFAIAGFAFGKMGGMRRPVLTRGVASRIFAAGFLIFLAGMLLQVNIQLERWYVTAELGVEALGHLFVAIMFVTVLQLVPSALDAVFLPTAVRAKARGDDPALIATLRSYFFLLLAYVVLAGATVWLLAEPVLELLAARYLPDLVYVYLITPGALLLNLSAVFGLTFLILIRYRYLLIAYAGGTALLAAVLGVALWQEVALTLAQVSIARSSGLAFTAVLLVLGWWIISRDQPGLRFAGRTTHDN